MAKAKKIKLHKGKVVFIESRDGFLVMSPEKCGEQPGRYLKDRIDRGDASLRSSDPFFCTLVYAGGYLRNNYIYLLEPMSKTKYAVRQENYLSQLKHAEAGGALSGWWGYKTSQGGYLTLVYLGLEKAYESQVAHEKAKAEKKEKRRLERIAEEEAKAKRRVARAARKIEIEAEKKAKEERKIAREKAKIARDAVKAFRAEQKARKK